MKKIALICLFAILFALLCSCGNMSMGIGNYTFNKIHIYNGDSSKCLTIIKWYENDRGVEVLTEEVGAVFCSEGTYVLLENHCPFCEE